MEAFGISVRGFASAVELFVHPSAITAAEIMELFRKIAECYERFVCRLRISTMVEEFYDQVNNYLTRLLHYIHGKNVELPSRVSTITHELQNALDNKHVRSGMTTCRSAYYTQLRARTNRFTLHRRTRSGPDRKIRLHWQRDEQKFRSRDRRQVVVRQRRTTKAEVCTQIIVLKTKLCQKDTNELSLLLMSK